MSFELKLKQQQKYWREISMLKDKIEKLKKDDVIIRAQHLSLCQQIPILTKELYKLMDEYDKTW